ncbi:MAG: lysophospholipid acyltransferase family protein [Gemmatimonadota bacterium]
MTGVTDLLEYAAARGAFGLLGRIPGGVAGRLGAGLGGLAYALRARRAVVLRQIAAAFPGADRARVEEIAEASYRHFGRETAEIARLQRTGTRELPDRVSTDAAADAWIERMRAGEGALIVTGHVGNWEVSGAMLAARGVPLAAVVKRQSNARFDRWLADARRRLGIEPVYMEEAIRVVPRLLRAGRSVALVADQDARSHGVIVTFLGRPASTFRGPARLALATGAPLVFGASVREDDGYRVRMETVREGGVEAGGRAARSDRDVERALTRGWVERLEAHVRRFPEQYFWFHRRWKSGDRNEPRADAVSRAGSGSMGRIRSERTRSEGDGTDMNRDDGSNR